MKQALHIFRKDLRGLWVQIATVLGLHVLYCVLRIRESNAQQFDSAMGQGDVVAVLLVLGWFAVIAAAVHEEALPGVRQFWLTRPYSIPSLIGAKLLICAAVVNLPLFVSDLVLLYAHGLPLASAVPALLARQVITAMTYLAPAFVLSVITSTAAGFWTSVFAAIVLGISSLTVAQQIAHGSVGAVGINVSGSGSPWTLALMAGAAAGIVWQYRTRRTRMGRVVVFGAICALPAGLFWTPWKAAPPAFPAPAGEYARFDVVWDSQRAARTGTPAPPFPSVRLDIPVRVEGLRGQEEAQAFAGSASLQASKSSLAVGGGGLEKNESGYWLTLWIGRDKLESLQAAPVQLSTTLIVRIRAAEPIAVVPPGRKVFAAGVGQCRIRHTQLVCLVGPTDPTEHRVRLITRAGTSPAVSDFGAFSHDVLPAVWGLSPVERLSVPLPAPKGQDVRLLLAQPETKVEISALRTRAQFQKEIRIGSLNLSAYRTVNE